MTFTVLTYIITMGIAIALVTTTSLLGDLLSFTGRPVIGAFFVYSRATALPFATNLLYVVYACIIVYGACLAAGFRSRGGFVRGLQKLARAGRITRSSNWLVAMPLISCGLLITVVLVTVLLNDVGVSSGSLCDPKLNSCPSQAQLFAGLVYAPIGEELAYRILTPLALVVPVRILWRRVVTGHRPSVSNFLYVVGLSFLSPEYAKSKIGYPTVATSGWRGIHWLEWILIVFSSALFGLAHVQTGGGTDWGAGKVVTAATSGLALGVAYVSYGAYATILLHWFFDFYVEVLNIGSSILGGIYAIFPFLFFTSTILVGSLSVIVGIIWLTKRTANRLRPTAYKPPDSFSDPPRV